jgi:hypothetical protein
MCNLCHNTYKPNTTILKQGIKDFIPNMKNEETTKICNIQLNETIYIQCFDNDQNGQTITFFQ